MVRRSDTGGIDSDVEAAGTDVAAVFERGLIGSPGQIVDRIGQLADAGFTRLYLTTPREFDVDHFADFMQFVAPQIR